MYETEDGKHHQSNFTFEVDVASMTARTFEEVDGDRWGTPYVSHSFQQLVTMHQGNLVFVDHGDAYPRSIDMHVVANYPSQRASKEDELFKFAGNVGDNATGAAVTGLVSGSAGVVVVGNSVRHTGGTFDENERRNVFAITADPATGASTTHWLTEFAPKGADDAGEPRVVPVAEDRFAVLFAVTRGGSIRTEYRLIDSTARVLGSATLPGVPFAAGAEPLVSGGLLSWLVGVPRHRGDGQDAYAFSLDLTDPTAPTLVR